MRGKKVDSQFLTDFISTCVMAGHATPDEISNAAQQEIDHINYEIRRIEELKIRRAKLLDVIAAFKGPTKTSKEEARILCFFQIQNPHICKYICDFIKIQPFSRDKLVGHSFSIHDLNFCIKQLLEHRVIVKVGEIFVRGECFDEYLKFVLQEG